jgi:uncharacterized RDD family membrane protein YckC
MAQEVIYCSKCGSQNLAGASFCQHCGANMGPAVVPGVMASPVGVSYSGAVPADNSAYGGFWIRFVAIIIDWVILGAVIYPAFSIPRYGYDQHFGAFQGFGFFAGWLYEALLLSSPWQATIGKKLLGLKVTDEAGQRLSFGRATGRHFAKIISMIICFIGFIMAAFTYHKRALHDMIAGTLVMKERV